MLMTEEIEKLQGKVDNPEELVGFIALLSRNIEWNTGKLIGVRNKNQLKYADLLEIFKSKRKLDRILNGLQEHGLLTNTKDGYFVSRKLIKKGKSNNDTNRD